MTDDGHVPAEVKKIIVSLVEWKLEFGLVRLRINPRRCEALCEPGPAEAIFHWSGLYEIFLCNNLNEVVVVQRAREGFALAKLGGSGGMLPRKILDFWTLQNAILGILANFSNTIECYFARSLGKRNRICAHANEMHRYAF